MNPLSNNDIVAELSYAYLHAVAAHAGMACQNATRLEDGNGIDARLTAWGSWPDSYFTEIDVKVQLKATTHLPVDDGTHFSYFVKGPDRYDDLRSQALTITRILVVLFLPKDQQSWLTHTAEQLVMKRCAYWVHLRGAAATTNGTGATVKIPKTQVFSPDNLKALVAQIAQKQLPDYKDGDAP